MVGREDFIAIKLFAHGPQDRIDAEQALLALARRGCAVRESGSLGEIQGPANDGWRLYLIDDEGADAGTLSGWARTVVSQ